MATAAPRRFRRRRRGGDTEGLQEAGNVGGSRVVEDERTRERDTAESLRQLLAKIDGSQESMPAATSESVGAGGASPVTAANVCRTASSSAAADAGATAAVDAGATAEAATATLAGAAGADADGEGLQEAGDIGSSRVVEDE